MRKFFKKLFGLGPRGTAHDQVTEVVAPDPALFQPIPKWTHGGKKGKSVFCPECSSATHVYNFKWSALVCGHCSAAVNKRDWLMRVAK
jgi:hypothetical protein